MTKKVYKQTVIIKNSSWQILTMTLGTFKR